MKKLILILSVAVFMLTGCASAPKRPFMEVTSIPQGKGVVYIYMPSKENYLNELDVRVDNIEGIGTIAGNLLKGTYVSYMAPVGDNLFRAEKKAVNITVEEGQSYFVKIKTYKFFGIRIELTEIDPSAGFVHIKTTQQR